MEKVHSVSRSHGPFAKTDQKAVCPEHSDDTQSNRQGVIKRVQNPDTLRLKYSNHRKACTRSKEPDNRNPELGQHKHKDDENNKMGGRDGEMRA